MKKTKEKCTCDTKIDDGYFDLPCPVHDKDENELTKEERRKSVTRIIQRAEKLKW